jgi:hypothetical protein
LATIFEVAQVELPRLDLELELAALARFQCFAVLGAILIEQIDQTRRPQVIFEASHFSDRGRRSDNDQKLGGLSAKILQRPDMNAGFVAQADRCHQRAVERFQRLLLIGFSFR